jgi:F-type H+-transporting ATPase subunit epsilon
MPIHVELVTQERKLFEEKEADMVILPAVEGEMGVLPHHAPLLTTLTFGEMVVRKGTAEEHFVIYGGVVDVRPDKVVVLADTADSAMNADLSTLEAARDSAMKLMQSGVASEGNREATLALRRAELALKVARKMQSSGPMIRILKDEE